MQLVMKDYNLEHFSQKDIYSWEEVIHILEGMENEIYSLQEEHNSFKQQIEDNYKPILAAEQYGISDRDFI